LQFLPNVIDGKKEKESHMSILKRVVGSDEVTPGKQVILIMQLLSLPLLKSILDGQQEVEKHLRHFIRNMQTVYVAYILFIINSYPHSMY
jgi:hypothetical protein